MAITSYSELKTALGNWSTRTNLTSAQLDEFIAQAENWLKREPQPPESPDIGGVRGDIQHATGTLTASSDEIAKPSDYAQHFRFRITGDNRKTLRYLDPYQLVVRKKGGTGEPTYYTVTDVIEFDVASDSAYPYELSYWPNVTALSDSNTTNWVITNYSDVYLSAAMYWLNRWAKDDKEAASWLGQYKVAAWSASNTYAQSLVSQSSIAVRPDTVTP